MDTRPKTIYLPDTMVNWPWPRTINPHYEDVKAEADASFRDFKALSLKSQEAFDKCDFALLTALLYPKAPREHFRIACDLINFFFIYDEYTDFKNEALAKEMADIVVDALQNPHKKRPEDECILGEIARQFWARAIKSASLSSQRRFLEISSAYFYSMIDEALDRGQDHWRSLDDYLKLRRKTIGVQPTFLILQMGINLPDEVLNHPVIMDLAECITDLALIDNDMFSYNKEQAVRDEGHNIISVIMFDLGLDVSGAMAWAAHYHTEVQKRFIDGLAKVPSWGPSVDVLVKEYLDRTAIWVRGNQSWCHESLRYLGTMSPDIRKTRLVPLLPRPDRKVMYDVGYLATC